MLKRIGSFVVTALGLLLLVYSATRSLDFISLTLPEDRQVLAYFGLAALDGGLIAWLLAYLYGSSGAWQRGISLMMILLDLLGAVGMFTLDTIYQAGVSGLVTVLTPAEMQGAVLLLSGVIGLNISATIAHHILEPGHMKAAAEAEAFDKIDDMAIKQISAKADQLAAQVAPVLAAEWLENTRARYMARVPGALKALPEIDTTARTAAPPVPAEKSAIMGRRYNLGRNLWRRPVKVLESSVQLEQVSPNARNTRIKKGST